MRTRYILLLFLILTIGACSTTNMAPTKSQLEIREFQTRTYEINDTKMVMKAVLNVLQDDGFIVKNANIDLGLLVAEKEVDIDRLKKGTKMLLGLFSIYGVTWSKSAKTEATANVSEFGKTTKVRVNFLVTIYNNKGAPKKIEKIEDLKFYQEFFSKVDKGIFIQKENL